MNKSPSQMPIMALMGIRTQFLFSSSTSSPPCVPSSFSPSPPSSHPLPPGVDGRERFTVRGHTLVLISLSRLERTKHTESHSSFWLSRRGQWKTGGQKQAICVVVACFFVPFFFLSFPLTASNVCSNLGGLGFKWGKMILNVVLAFFLACFSILK